MVTTTLKLRADLLSAEVVDAEGVLYYDVSDPKTGGVLRLFDYEWLIAQRLDGQHSLDDLARWTEEQFGFATSRDDLQVYAERLQQLGLVDGAAAAGHKPLPTALFASAALHKLGIIPTTAGVAAPTPAAAPVQAPTTQAAPVQATPVQAAPVQPAPVPTTPRVAPIKPAVTTSRDKPSEPGDQRRPNRDEDVMGQPFLSPTRPTTPALARPVATTPAPVAPPAVTPVVTPIVTPAVVAPVEPEPLSQPPQVAARGKSDMLDAIGSLPPPAEDELPKAPTPSGPVQQIQPPVAQPEPAASPFNVSAAALLDQPVEPTPSKEPQIPIEQEPVVRPAEPVKPVEPTPVPRPVQPAVDPIAPTVRAATVEPIKPATSEPVKPVAVEPAVVPSAKTPTKQQQSGGAGKVFVALLVIAILAALGYYFLVLKQPAPPASVGVSVSVAKPEDVARSFPTAAVVKKGEPQPLKIDADGTVTKVVAENTEVVLDTVLVQLDTQTKFNKELVDLRERLSFYQKKLEAPKNKGKQDVLKDAQAKISEKQQRLEQVETLVKKSQLVAPRPGAVSKVMVKVGQAVTAGTEVVALADKALAAEIKIPAIEAQGMKVGQDAQLAGTGGPVTARVAALRTEGDYAMVQFLLPENATAKPGDELKLQRAALSQVVRMPAAALVDGSKVFVLRDGKAATLPVTVADRDGDAVLLQGLPSGEQVIVKHPSELHEGASVSVAPTAP